jgi:hypothetical protein
LCGVGPVGRFCAQDSGGRMRPLPFSGEQVCLSPVVEKLLVDVVEDGFTLYSCGPKTAPNALVACYHWGQYADLLTVRDFDWVVTARMPIPAPVDIFAPQVVVWAYEGAPQHAIRALLSLVHPMHPDAPVADYPAPARLRVPRAQQRPMTIQLPLPGRARARAKRLATAITTSHTRRPPSPRLTAG